MRDETIGLVEDGRVTMKRLVLSFLVVPLLAAPAAAADTVPATLALGASPSTMRSG